ncbi:MAG: TonB-dependent receptor [Bacteroidota bacterium]
MLLKPSLYNLIVSFFFILPAVGQKNERDTFIVKSLDEVVLTATRTEKSIGDIPVPIQVISKNFIQQTGSQKLIDVLQQQTGLIADNPLGQALQGYPNPFGSGIQMQGLDPGYTLILLDGEPLTGRNAGILNLGRIAVGNIKQVEIIKGPATSLYGSDALAGVINIITEKAKENNTQLQLHHATNNTWGITANQSVKTKKTSLQLFANRYSSRGYDLDKNIYGQTIDPYHNYSFSAKQLFDINRNNKLQSSARLFYQKQFNNYLIYVNSSPDTVKGNTKELDWSFNNQWTHSFNSKTKIFTRLYTTGYRNDANIYLQKNNELFDNYYLHQYLLKPEVQLEVSDKKDQKFISGVGMNYEIIASSRYASKKYFTTTYLFAQKEWAFQKKLNITLGARLDKNTLYKAQLNPKIAAAYKPSQKLKLIASIGSGYKTPDCRQQFLSFTNSLVGYTLFGAQELAAGLKQLKQNGEIDSSISIYRYSYKKNLLPERSWGTNIGFTYSFSNKTSISMNAFRNDIKNLIEIYSMPFTKVNGQSIYCYENVSKVFTQGLDVNFHHSFWQKISINASYQLLYAKDKDVIKKIKAREVVKRDPYTYESSYTTLNEYGGLYNRSRHTANLQFVYDDPVNKWNTSFRTTYRGRYGYADINGSQILDDDREYAKGYFNMHISIAKTIFSGITLQAGSDNLLNYTDKQKLPNLFGRTYFINCNINFKQL